MYAYQSIYYDLKNSIYSGEYPHGQRIPTEKTLMSQYDVSRMTVQKAIAQLVKDGWISRYPGKGSYVDFQSPISRNNKKLCLILSRSSNHGLNEIIEGVKAYTEKESYDLAIYYLENNSSAIKYSKEIFEEEYAGYIIQNNIEHIPVQYLTQIFLENIPVILLDNKMHSFSFTCVSSDNIAGGYAAMDFALSQGHKRVAFLTTKKSLDYTSVRDRFIGFEKRRLETSNSHSDILYVESTNHHELRGCLKFWREQNGTCLICENDLIAIELIEVAYQMGWNVPKDISVIGFDNLKLSGKIQPGLTTLSQDFFQVGYIAGREIHSLFKPFGVKSDKINVQKHKKVPMTLIKRESVLSLE